MEPIGTLESVWRYPVKSMAGEAMERAFVGFAGIMGDRVHAFVRRPGPTAFPWLTGRELAALVMHRARFRAGAGVALPENVEGSFAMAPGVRAVSPPLDAFAVDVTTPAGAVRDLASAELRSELEAAAGCALDLVTSERPHVDCRPLSLLGNATPGGLAEELGRPVDRRRFRANLHVDWHAPRPFLEDDLVGRTLQVGDRARFALLERDPRCQMITLDPESAEPDTPLLRHVIKAHGGMVGVYAAVLAEGIIAPGDSVRLV